MAITLDGTNGITTPAVTNNGAYTGDGISFADNTPSNTLVTTTGGNVGIGTSSPARNVTITSSGNTTLQVTNSTSGSGASDGFIVQQNGLNSFALNQEAGALYLGTSNTERMTIDSSGNVGIGTSSPSQKLHVVQTTDANTDGIRIARNGNSAQYGSFSNYGGATWVTAVDTANNGNNVTVFNRSGNGTTFTESMRIDSSGNLLVGTTTVGGTGGLSILPAQSTGAAIARFNRANSTGTSYSIVFQNNSSDVGYISYTNTAVAYVTSSDYRLKENIAPMTGALATVSALKPVTYKWKIDGSDGQGFIAHELQAVVPDCVTGEKDAVDAEGNPVYQGIDTSFLVATLTAAIQELKAELDTVKTELATLKGTA